MVSSSPPLEDERWVLLSYRMPREPSTPRIAVWRKLKDLGVLQVGDGLVALPHTAETLEQLEWVGLKATDSGGEAIVWLAEPRRAGERRAMAAKLQEARTVEYEELLAEVETADAADRRSIARWRRQLRKIEQRDHLRAAGRDRVRLALDSCAAAVIEVDAGAVR